MGDDFEVYATRGTGIRDASRFELGRGGYPWRWVVRLCRPLSKEFIELVATGDAAHALRCFRVVEYGDTPVEIELKALADLEKER